jgi:hypothetical protein
MRVDSAGEGGGPGQLGLQPWLRPETLESLGELNESFLVLLAQPSGLPGATTDALTRQLAELWPLLDAPARRRAAACPYLLVDAGFADPARWQAAATREVGDAHRARYGTYFDVPAATSLARAVFTYAWHLVHSQAAAARLLLGMPAASAFVIGQYTLLQIQELAESHPEWLQPRWPARLQLWRELLLAAAAGEAGALARARLRGFTLLAAEVRRAAG